MTPTVRGGAAPDFGRMRADRTARLRAEMATRGLDALVLRSTAHTVYAGADGPCIVRAHGEPEP